MEFYKPAILIGLLSEDEVLIQRADEVAWGIEEGGCLSERYVMEGNLDIRYSISDTTVLLLEKEGRLYVNELNKDICLLSVTDHKQLDYRELGKNAARYLKKLKLCFSDS